MTAIPTSRKIPDEFLRNPGGDGGSSIVPAVHVTVDETETYLFDLTERVSDLVVNFTLNAGLTVEVTDLPETTDKAFVLTLTFLQGTGGGHAVSWTYPEDSIYWPSGAEIIPGDTEGEMTIVTLFWNGAKFVASKSCGYNLP